MRDRHRTVDERANTDDCGQFFLTEVAEAVEEAVANSPRLGKLAVTLLIVS